MFALEKATALYTINSQILTQITCHSYLRIHIELLYLVASRQLALGNTSWICLMSRNNISHPERRYYPLPAMWMKFAMLPPFNFVQISNLENNPLISICFNKYFLEASHVKNHLHLFFKIQDNYRNFYEGKDIF